MPVAAWRANLGALRMEDLALPLTKCRNPGRRPGTFPGQSNSADPDSVSVDELDPQVGEQN